MCYNHILVHLPDIKIVVSKSVNIVVGADRLKEFENLANKYNGDLYDFDRIRVISAGERDAESEGVEGMSASKLRAAAVKGDFDTFRKGVPKPLGLSLIHI